jgi:uncharacterized protein YaaN involved in tellurite resistance
VDLHVILLLDDLEKVEAVARQQVEDIPALQRTILRLEEKISRARMELES